MSNPLLQKIVAIGVGLLIVGLGYQAVRFPEKFQNWHRRHYFGEKPPEKPNIFYNMATSPSAITSNKIVGAGFIIVGIFLIILSLLPQ